MKGVDLASFGAASRIYRHLAVQHEPDSELRNVGDPEFERFLRAIDTYRRVRAQAPVISPEGAKALEAALAPLEPMLQTDVFPPALKLAAFLTQDRPKAIDHVERYIRLIAPRKDEKAEELLERLRKQEQERHDDQARQSLAAQSTAFAPVALSPGARIRVGPPDAEGSIACVVRNDAGTRYLVTASYLLRSAQHIRQVIPNRDRPIGSVDRSLVHDDQPIAFAPLEPNTLYTSAFGKLAITKTIAVSALEVKQPILLLRSVGGEMEQVKGAVRELAITQPDMPGVIGIDAISRPGDGGAPVVTEDGRLIGIVYARGGDMTYVAPVLPTLEARGLVLVE